jgi:hypothetical protein
MLVFSKLCVCEVLHASEDNSELGASEHPISIPLRILGDELSSPSCASLENGEYAFLYNSVGIECAEDENRKNMRDTARHLGDAAAAMQVPQPKVHGIHEL